MKIGIYDDDENFIKIIHAMVGITLQQNNVEFEMNVIHDFTEYNRVIENTELDVIFLDIDMPEKTGIEIAEDLRSKFADIDIIFLTNREDLVFQSIHYAPFRFIRKANVTEELPEALMAYIQKYNTSKKEMEFIENGNKVKVLLKDIVYIESNKHYANLFTKEKKIVVRSSINELEVKLYDYGFVRIQRSFIVNVFYISNINYSEVIMTTGDKFPVKRGSSERLKKEYYENKRKKIYGNIK